MNTEKSIELTQICEKLNDQLLVLHDAMAVMPHKVSVLERAVSKLQTSDMDISLSSMLSSNF